MDLHSTKLALSDLEYFRKEAEERQNIIEELDKKTSVSDVNFFCKVIKRFFGIKKEPFVTKCIGGDFIHIDYDEELINDVKEAFIKSKKRFEDLYYKNLSEMQNPLNTI